MHGLSRNIPSDLLIVSSDFPSNFTLCGFHFFEFSRDHIEPLLNRKAFRKQPSEQKTHFAAIERVLFPDGAKDENKLNDVDIVYESAAWKHILVTNDGDSAAQPRGILGSREELATLDATVMHAGEAVAFIRGKIDQRDSRVASVCAVTNTTVPEWLGKD
jgi:hypothetical protein